MVNFKCKSPVKQATFHEIKRIIMLLLPFILMDLITRIMATGVKYFQGPIVFPNILFTVTWMALIVVVVRNLKGNAGRIVYSILFAIFFVLFLAHSVYYPYTGFFFSFSLLQSAEEGSAYIWDTLRNTNFWNLASCVLVLVSGIFVIVKFPRAKKNCIRNILICLVVFAILQCVTPMFLGKANRSLEWDTWRNPRNVYENFNDSNKSIKICGFFQYTARDFYVTFSKPEDKQDPEEIAFLKDEYSTKTPHAENEYTGIFEGKNVIFLQLEGLDSWLLTPEDTPNLFGMLNNSVVFDNHYSYYTGGGSTFNSELAVTTGFLTPISYTKNPYSFNKNLYPASLPKQLKKLGYSANAFHMNRGEYYMRELNYLNWGYDHYYSLLDDSNYNDVSYQLDRELIMNEFFYNKMFCQKTPFMNYIISYTPHTPFSLDSKMGRLLAEKVFGEDAEIPEMSEEQVARLFASETDFMVGLLLEALEKNNLIDNTVIVVFADHYLYTLNDKTVLDKYKNSENNLINHTPFFIWGKDVKKTHIKKVNSQLDILPTVLNMLGVEYVEEYYIGQDIMDEDYNGFVFFSDYSWYDGENYVEYGQAENDNNIDEGYINQTNALINTLIKKNDLTLKYNYFKTLEKK